MKVVEKLGVFYFVLGLILWILAEIVIIDAYPRINTDAIFCGIIALGIIFLGGYFYLALGRNENGETK